jgi:hypothetical protein
MVLGLPFFPIRQGIYSLLALLPPSLWGISKKALTRHQKLLPDLGLPSFQNCKK